MQDDHKIERFVFPDGTEIDMIVFDDPQAIRSLPGRTAGATAATAQQPQAPARPGPAVSPSGEGADARVCPHCGCDLVYPVDWERRAESVWELVLRCPECETRRHVLLGRAAVEAFNRELYLGARSLAREAERLTRANFEDEVERITAALERDLILPMDF